MTTFEELACARRSIRKYAPDPVRPEDLAALLHIGDRQCALILRRMVEAGQLERRGQRYTLPAEREAMV